MSNQEVLLSLIRLGVGNETPGRFILNGVIHIDWKEVQKLANKQGVTALVMDGVEKLPEAYRPPKEALLNWIGEVLQGYEYRYQSYCSTLAELSALFNTYGIKMMVIKGYACGIHWPKPEHRPYGDIDIYLFGKYKEADEVLRKLGVNINKGLHHHTVFGYKGETVENHFDFVNVHGSTENAEIEKILKKLSEDDTRTTTIRGQKIYMPSPNLHALFLLIHARGHFVSTSLNLRQVLDWAFFVREYSKEIDWEWLIALMDKYFMRHFFNCVNAICIGDLGFEVNMFPVVRFDPSLKDRVLNDIMNPKFGKEEPKLLIPRLVFKYKRWRSNDWKRRMCYEESDLSMFIRSVWKHLLKPASI